MKLEFSALESTLSPAQSSMLGDLKNKINEFVKQSEKKNRNRYEEEITKLKVGFTLKDCQNVFLDVCF